MEVHARKTRRKGTIRGIIEMMSMSGVQCLQELTMSKESKRGLISTICFTFWVSV